MTAGLQSPGGAGAGASPVQRADPSHLRVLEGEDLGAPTPRIALVNVPYGNPGGASMRPLGLASLGAFIQAQGIAVRGFDFSDSGASAEELVERHRLGSYALVGLSFYNSNAKLAFPLARAIKKANPACVVVAGGAHATATHERVFLHHPEIDVVVRNEGEESFRELLLACAGRLSFDAVAGISFHRNGTIQVNPDRDRLDDLDALPAPTFRFVREEPEKVSLFYDQDTGQFKKSTSLVTSRSCPYDCSFCAIILIGRAWRRASPGKVVDDLRALEQEQDEVFGHVNFLDANFFVDARRTLEVAEALHAYRPSLTFHFSTRVNQLIRGKKYLPELRRLGLRAVELGIESGSDEALQRFTKRTTRKMNEEAVELLRELDLQLLLDFIMFDAEASLLDLWKNLDFLETTGLDSYVSWDHLFSYMTPYLGTAIRKRYEELLDTAFDDDELPKAESLFLRPEVRSVFTEFRRLTHWISDLNDLVTRNEDRLHDLGGSWNRDIARRMLNAATVRRLPFVTLRNLVRQANGRRDVNLESALPVFHRGGGPGTLTLEEFMADALQ